MKLIDLMCLCTVKHFYIINKKNKLLIHFLTGVHDLNDYDYKIFELEVLDIKVIEGVLSGGLTIKIDYEVEK